MRRPNIYIFTVYVLVVIAVLGGVSVSKGVFLIAKHEGDTLHLMQILLRMSEGQVPHIDFMTPIGILAFAPITLFLKAGYGVGMSILASQIVLALLLLPGVVWAAASRLSGVLAYFYGFVVMVLALALVHGETNASVSISMHYNRWAWGFAFVALLLALQRPKHRKSGGIDGIFAGSALAALAMIKVTYFAAIIIPVSLGFLLTRQFRALGATLVSGLVIAGAITLLMGMPFWWAYFADLLAVAGSEVRPFPGRNFVNVVTLPAFLGGSVVAIMAIIFLRQAGRAATGAILLFLIPGFFYITFQNFGNDPQWLLFLGVLLFSEARNIRGATGMFGWDMREGVKILGVMALCFAAPSLVNLTFSPFRHLSADAADYAPMLPRAGLHGDLMTRSIRAARVDATVPLAAEGSGLGAWEEMASREEAGTLFGVALAQCELSMGIPAWFDAIASDIDAAGFGEGKRIFAADLFSSHWMFGDALPLRGGAPWFYGGLPGFESADYVIVPQCAISVKVRRQIIELIEQEGSRLEEVRRTPLYILLEKV